MPFDLAQDANQKMCKTKGHKCLSAWATAQPQSLALVILFLLLKQPKKKKGRKPGFAQDFYVEHIFQQFSFSNLNTNLHKIYKIHQILLCMVSAYLQKTQQPTVHASALSPKYSSKPNSIFFFFLYNSQATQFGTNLSQRLCTYYTIWRYNRVFQKNRQNIGFTRYFMRGKKNIFAYVTAKFNSVNKVRNK